MSCSINHRENKIQSSGLLPRKWIYLPIPKLKLVESVATELVDEHIVNQIQILYNDITNPLHTLTVL
jgi:hypothetical protein